MQRLPRCFRTAGWLALLAVASLTAGARTESSLAGHEVVARVSPSVVLILVGDGRGETSRSGSGVIVGSDGVLLTAYHVVKDAREVQVRLHNGETYDRVELIAADERRDVAALRIPVVGLPELPVARAERVQVGETVYVISNPRLLGWTVSEGIVSSMRRAEDIPDVGNGYRLLQFTAPVSPGSSGGPLVDSRGRVLGIVVGSIHGQGLNFAVPIESVLGLTRAARGTALEPGRDLYLPTEARALRPTNLEETSPPELLQSARAIYVRTRDERHFPTDTLIAELLKRREFHHWGLLLVKEEKAADLLIEIDHPLHLFDFTFVVTDRKTSVVLASGKLVAWDGIRAAPDIAQGIVAGLRTTLQAAPPRLKRRSHAE